MTTWTYKKLTEWIEQGSVMNEDVLSVTVLYCGHQNLDFLPVQIALLVNLEVLYCDFNKLRYIPTQLFYLRKLKKLYCNNNLIEYLPHAIENLKSLELLFCGHNCLKTIPAELLCLEHIYTVYLNNNQLMSLFNVFTPGYIFNLNRFIPTVKKLYIDNNLLTSIPDELKRANIFIECSFNKLPPHQIFGGCTSRGQDRERIY